MIARILLCALLAASTAAGGAEGSTGAAADEPTFSLIGRPERIVPAGSPHAAVVLFSGAAGWGAAERAQASALAARGTVVFGIDTPATLKRIDTTAKAEDGDCAILIGEIEALSHQAQRTLDSASYHFPLLAGVGDGGALALAVGGQAEAATIAGVLAVDPSPVLHTQRAICSDGGRRASAGGYVYHLPPGHLPYSVDITLSAAATHAGRAHAQALVHGRAEVPLNQAAQPAAEAFAARLAVPPRAPASDGVDDLPLIELAAERPGDTFAVFYSGDGGWRDLDKDLAAILQREGVSVVGVDVLRYFWKHREPGPAAVDLGRIIRAYQHKWGAKRVALIGFSFGADVLPALYNRLDGAERASVVQLSLLGLAANASFEVTVSNWLNHDPGHARSTLDEIARIPPQLLQCFYGEDDETAVCPHLQASGAEIIHTTGGHHFDGDYDALARHVLDGLARRTRTAPAAVHD